MIRIAVDCRPLVGHRSGIGRYLYEILRELAARDDDVEYYLYAPGEIDLPEQCRRDPRYRVRLRRFRPGILWLHLAVPIWLVQDKVDVFWGPNYALPLVSTRKVRYVLTIHDTTFARFPETMYWVTRLHNQLMVPLYSKKANVILTDSFFSQNELKEILALERKVKVVYLAAKSQEEWPSFETIDMDRPFILTVGTIEPRKNLIRLITAFSKLPRQVKDTYSLVIVGADGWGNVDLNHYIEECGLKENVLPLGRVTDGQLAYLYSQAKLVIMPSLYEGFGLPVLEAMSFVRPVLCSYSSSVGEIGAGAALLFDPLSITDITFKMALALQNNELLEELGFRSREHVRKFSWGKAAEETLSYLIGGD